MLAAVTERIYTYTFTRFCDKLLLRPIPPTKTEKRANSK